MGDIYVGINGQPKKVVGIWVGVNGVPKKVKNAWVGVNNQPKVVYVGLGKAVVTGVDSDGTVHWEYATGAVRYKVKKYDESTGTWVTSSVFTANNYYKLASFNGNITMVAVIAYDARTSTANTTVSDNYIIPYYLVTFDANGGTCDEDHRNVYPGNQVGDLPTPTRGGYYFGYWYVNSSMIRATDIPTEDWLAYAYWQLILQKSSVKSVDHTGLVKCEPATGATQYAVWYYNGSWTLTSKSTSTSITVPNFGTSTTKLSVMTYDDFGNSLDSDDYTVKWVRITFNANGGSCSTSYYDRISGEQIGSLPTATRSNYDFDGWYDGTTQLTIRSEFTSNKTVYAHWTAAVVYVTVYYKGNGGTPSKSSDTVESGTRVMSASCSRSNNTSGTVCYNYYCTGWYTSSSGGSLIVDTLDYFNPTSNMTLYAHWSTTSYLKIPSSTSATKGSKTFSFKIHNPSGKTIYYRFYKTVNGSTWYSESSNHSTTSNGTITATLNMNNAGDIHYYTIKISDGSLVTWSDVTRASGGTYQSTVNPPSDWEQPVDDYA